MRYLSDRDVRRLMPDTGKSLELIEETLSALADCAVEMPPRTTLTSAGASRFIAFPARLPRLGVAGVKWFGIDHQSQATRKAASAQILLTAEEGAKPLGIIDAAWITAWRTALMSLHAARTLAHPRSSRIAFIACGEQARLHLELFRSCFPLTHLSAWSRTTAGEFVGEAHALGLSAQVAPSIAACVKGAEIVIASCPALPPARFSSGDVNAAAFVSLVDLGRSFVCEALVPTDSVYVDDLSQARSLIARGDIAAMGEAELRPLGGSGLPDPGTAPRIFLPTGLGAIDIAFAYFIWRAAMETGVGLDLGDEHGRT